MINIKIDNKLIHQIKEYDKKALESYKKTSDKVAFITSIFINNILDDISFIDINYKNNSRYIYAVLRVTIEQLIIYKFLMRDSVDNEKLCEDYLGGNIDIEKIEELNEPFIESLKLLGGKRTKLYKNSFIQMASEFECVKEEDSLYNLYSMMADYVHNAYYEKIISDIGYISEEDAISEEDTISEENTLNNIVLYILISFIESIPIALK